MPGAIRCFSSNFVFAHGVTYRSLAAILPTKPTILVHCKLVKDCKCKVDRYAAFLEPSLLCQLIMGFDVYKFLI